MSMVTWSFLDLHPSYSGWLASERRAVSVAQGRDAFEELVDPGEQGRVSRSELGARAVTARTLATPSRIRRTSH